MISPVFLVDGWSLQAQRSGLNLFGAEQPWPEFLDSRLGQGAVMANPLSTSQRNWPNRGLHASVGFKVYGKLASSRRWVKRRFSL